MRLRKEFKNASRSISETTEVLRRLSLSSPRLKLVESKFERSSSSNIKSILLKTTKIKMVDIFFSFDVKI